MEPIASSGSGAVFRPAAGGTPSELTALLRDGRVLSAEVLTGTAQGTVMLAIGRHTIPAESELELDPGARFLVQVEAQADAVVLRMLGAGEGEESALLRALRAVVGEERPLGEALGELHALLRGRADLPPELADLARALAAQTAAPSGDAGALQARLAALGLGHEAALALLLGSRAGHAAFEKLRGDLKALLLRAHAALEEGAGPAELREAVARALAGVEAEQLLNAAREKAGEPLVWSFPFPDGERWATARLALPPRREGRARDGDADQPFRLTLGLELSRLGALRADLTLGPGLLSVRLLVTRVELLRRIARELEGLRRALSGGARAVELSARLGTAREASYGLEPLDIAYLREHHLMNVSV